MEHFVTLVDAVVALVVPHKAGGVVVPVRRVRRAAAGGAALRAGVEFVAQVGRRSPALGVGGERPRASDLRPWWRRRRLVRHRVRVGIRALGQQ